MSVSDSLSARPRSGVPARRPVLLPDSLRSYLRARVQEVAGLSLVALGAALVVALASYTPTDPSWNVAEMEGPVANLLGPIGSYPADLLVQTIGGAAVVLAVVPLVWGAGLLRHRPLGQVWLRLLGLALATPLLAAGLNAVAAPASWDLQTHLGGVVGPMLVGAIGESVMLAGGPTSYGWVQPGALVLGGLMLLVALGLTPAEWLRIGRRTWRFLKSCWRTLRLAWRWTVWGWQVSVGRLAALAWERWQARRRGNPFAEDAAFEHHDRADRHDQHHQRREPVFAAGDRAAAPPTAPPTASPASRMPPRPSPLSSVTVTPPAPQKTADVRQASLALGAPDGDYLLPPLELLHRPAGNASTEEMDEEALRHNAGLLHSVLGDFGVRGEIVHVSPGPVVTLYELEPAPGTKSSRVIGLSDDVARSMSAVSVRVAVVPGRNAIGIELPNPVREIVYLRDLLSSDPYGKHSGKLPLVLGKDIGGNPILADLARMPHLLVAGTTGSGKSVAINVMILSLLYRMSPDKVRLILVDPKMLELSVYEGIPHLLAPVVTDPKKAVVALKWAVREMEDRYRAMSKLGVRNIEGYNQRLRDARARGETLMRKVQTGFDPDTGRPIYEDQPLDLTELPYIVVVVDEMADLMLVAGKDIEAAIQRLAQMARAAGIHLIMATQRPSVDVITGTIKANFPTRISFQVTSKIDSRTILGEGGAENLLGQGDMLYMAGGGRITRVHGPFVRDEEVEEVVHFLKSQGVPAYNDAILEDDFEPGGDADGGLDGGDSGDQLYDQAVALVAREGKASTSFIQRHLQIGYNRAARIIEKMETEGVVSQANHVGKREVLVGQR
ncbi:MAG: DNA translocase FtsK 4TM domain-containing protein [Rhodospirillaceae bacterium]|nr:DNA translocase FtsK 4TM domain-containing protein [Rhodospirillaceae bacterium]